jgi:transcription initiation factor TFIID TATA-box-binding protein
MRKRRYSSLQKAPAGTKTATSKLRAPLLFQPQTTEGQSSIRIPIPLCHNIVSTSQIMTTLEEINLQRLASLFPFTTYDRKRFAAITIRLAHPHCTCLLFGSGKLVITGSTSFHACLVASQTITEMLRVVNPGDRFEVISCVIQNIVAHVELEPGQRIDLEALYSKFCEYSTYQKTIFPGLVLRPPDSPIVLLVFKSGRVVCTGGKSYDDIYLGFMQMFKILQGYVFQETPHI